MCNDHKGDLRVLSCSTSINLPYKMVVNCNTVLFEFGALKTTRRAREWIELASETFVKTRWEAKHRVLLQGRRRDALCSVREVLCVFTERRWHWGGLNWTGAVLFLWTWNIFNTYELNSKFHIYSSTYMQCISPDAWRMLFSLTWCYCDIFLIKTNWPFLFNVGL